MKRMALVGLPNSGKSSLFNALTGTGQKVANFPGITVEKKSGTLTHEGQKLELIDLPGIYSLDARTEDERLTQSYLLGKAQESVDLFILTIDATNLKKSLYLALQMQELKLPFIVVMNMIDLSDKRQQKIDYQKLEDALGVSGVIATAATSSKGILELKQALSGHIFENRDLSIDASFPSRAKEIDYISTRMKEVERLHEKIVISQIHPDSMTEKIDSFLLHPIWGVISLLAIFIFIFQVLFVGADPFIGLIESAFEVLAALVDSAFADGNLKSLIVDGVIGGVGSFVVFLPHIIFLFMLINFLEDVGYLGRVAFLLDYLMRKVGLPGKAVVPLLSSHACAIPGIMGARIIEDKGQRLVTMMISPLMTCSARLPVYTLLIAAIFSDSINFGPFDARGLLMFGLYFFAIFMGFLVAFLSKKVTATQTVNSFMMELPPYRLPKLKNIILNSWQKAVIFLKKAGTVIFVLSIILWGLVSFPKAPADAPKDQIHYSFAAYVGKTLEPIFKPIGFDWKITTSLIPSFAAREVLVSAMGTVMAVEEENEEALVTKLSELMRKEYSLATLLSLLVWFVFSPQCIATFGVLRRETNGYLYPAVFGVYTLALAYLTSFLTYSLFS